MTDRQLRDELHRIAEGAPEAYVPTDLFIRGRRAHRRSVALTIAASAVVIALVAGIASALTAGHTDRSLQPAEPVGPVLPSTIYLAPEWLTERDGTSGPSGYSHAHEMEGDLRLGVSAAAYLVSTHQSSVPVVVDGDGDYHLLDLPGFVGSGDAWWGLQRTVALSPDGRRLAWGYVEYTSPTHVENGMKRVRIAESGVRVADLRSGRVQEWNLSDLLDEDHSVWGLGWSPDSETVLYVADPQSGWSYEWDKTTSGSGGSPVMDPVAGVLTLDGSGAVGWKGDLHGPRPSTDDVPPVSDHEADWLLERLDLERVPNSAPERDRITAWAVGDDGSIAHATSTGYTVQTATGWRYSSTTDGDRSLTPTAVAFRGSDAYGLVPGAEGKAGHVTVLDPSRDESRVSVSGKDRVLGFAWAGSHVVATVNDLGDGHGGRLLETSRPDGRSRSLVGLRNESVSGGDGQPMFNYGDISSPKRHMFAAALTSTFAYDLLEPTATYPTRAAVEPDFPSRPIEPFLRVLIWTFIALGVLYLGSLLVRAKRDPWGAGRNLASLLLTAGTITLIFTVNLFLGLAAGIAGRFVLRRVHRRDGRLAWVPTPWSWRETALGVVSMVILAVAAASMLAAPSAPVPSHIVFGVLGTMMAAVAAAGVISWLRRRSS